ncbi:MAG: hypothetical protein ACYCT0_04755 [Sulfobacillus sp.]
MNTGVKVALALTGAGAIGGGVYYFVDQRRASSTTTPANGSTGTLASPGVSGAGNLGGAHTSQAGGTVTLTAPAQASVGRLITLMASAANIANPVYQFWYQDPAHSGASDGWTSSGAYGASAQFAFTPSAQGTYQVIAYARSASAPANESASQRPIYEANSDILTITVT